jgi:hypothetical protein
VGFSEDVIVESAPDITFLFNASYVSRRSEAY